MSWRYFRPYYQPSKPKKVKGGIKAGARTKGAGRSWWAKRWMAVLEGFAIGTRLSRGRSYARSGQVVSIEIEKGLVKARVQGTRSRPYKVEIRIKVLNAKQWKLLAGAFSAQAIYAAKLLAGQMPEDIEDIFRDVGLSLFPAEDEDLVTECSCPDWANPCKHIAAVYILLGEEFDRDPFLIFKLRGITRRELISALGGIEGHRPCKGAPRGKTEPVEENAHSPAPASASLPSDPSLFWRRPTPAADSIGELTIPATDAALPKRLGQFPFWKGETPLLPFLESIYPKASRHCLERFLAKFF